MANRIIDIRNYWSPVVRNTAEFQQIAKAVNPELNTLQDCIYRILNHVFIDENTTEYGVRCWENDLNISPENGDTLEDRKIRILTYLNIRLPYTLPVLKQMIASFVGEDNCNVECVKYRVIVHTNEIGESMLKPLEVLLGKVVPKNMCVEMFNHSLELHWRKYNKYSRCTNDEEMRVIEANFKEDLTESGGWYYDLASYESCFKFSKNYIFNGSSIKKFASSLPNATYLGVFLAACNNLQEVELYAAKASQVGGMLARCPKLTRFKGNLNGATHAGNFAIGDKKFSSFECGVPALVDGAGMFSNCILDKDSVLRVCGSLPTYTDGTEHLLTLGIHVDHTADKDVRTAIDSATAKGWTITTQWNGTASSGVAAVGLEEIYAKVVETEYGEYTDGNGTRCSLNWGHSVSSPEGKTPLEMGYTLFYSIDEACDYFNIKEAVENE